MSNFETINNERVLFIAIPRTGSVSIINNFGWEILGHQSIDFYKRQRNFTFTFVRNPYDRLLSAFMHLRNGGMNKIDRIEYDELLSCYHGDFKTFVLKGLGDIDKRQDLLKQQHLRPQMYQIQDVQNFDFIGRYENYLEDFLKVCDALYIPYLHYLKHENKTQHDPYYLVYNNTMKEIVYEVYKEDFEALNYSSEL